MESTTRASASGAADTLLKLIDGMLDELRPGARERAGLDTRLDRDLGLDSLARVELLARIERTFAIDLPSEVLGRVETPRDLLEAINTAGHRIESSRNQAEQLAQPEAAEGMPERAGTLVEVLEWHLARHPDRCHVTFYHDAEETETLSYAELAEAAAQVAGGLARAGIGPGQRVAIMLPSGLDFFRCFFGILFVGAVPVPLYPPARPAQIEDHLRRQAGILRNCGAPLMITFDMVRPLARVLTGLAPDLKQLVLTKELRSAPPMRAVRAAEHDFALFQYTSGSTGDPKGVTLTHRNLLANIRAWGRATEISSTDVGVSWLPLYHDMGLIGAWLGSLYHAFPLVLMSPLDFLARPQRWLWAIHRHRGTITAAPNFAFDLCVRRLEGESLDGLDLSSWRMAANGAEPISPGTLERFNATFERYGLRREALLPVYGLAECAVGLSVPPQGRGFRVDRVARETFMQHGRAEPAGGEDSHALRFVCCGAPLPEHEVRIVDAQGRPLPERYVGNLEFRGPSATAGYFHNQQATTALFHDGWLVSGDYAYLADGEIYITGRSKDMIIRGGRNFYPYDLEHAVGDLTGVRKGCVAVFGVYDSESCGERLVVVAETRERDAATRAALERRITEVAADLLGLPPDVVVLAPPHAVLKTSSGKIRRAAVSEAFRAGTLGASMRAPWRQFLSLSLSSLSGWSRHSLGRGGAWLYGAWVWMWFGLLAPIAILGILTLPGLPRRWAFARQLARLFARFAGYRIDVTGLDRRVSGPSIYAANHASYIDGFVIAAALPDPVRFVVKSELKDSKLLHRLFERLGAQFVERFDSHRSIEDAASLADIAADAAPLFFFAEGTFSAQSGLRAFRLGAFKIASQQGLPVVPVALAGTRQVLRDGSWMPQRGRIALTLCPAVEPRGNDWHDILALRDTVRREILMHCGEPDLDRM